MKIKCVCVCFLPVKAQSERNLSHSRKLIQQSFLVCVSRKCSNSFVFNSQTCWTRFQTASEHPQAAGNQSWSSSLRRRKDAELQYHVGPSHTKLNEYPAHHHDHHLPRYLHPTNWKFKLPKPAGEVIRWHLKQKIETHTLVQSISPRCDRKPSGGPLPHRTVCILTSPVTGTENWEAENPTQVWA